MPPEKAASELMGMSSADKNELLFKAGVNFNDLPNWQKRGSGLYWSAYEKSATNPITGEPVVVKRRKIFTSLDLPIKDDFRLFLTSILLNP